MAIENLKSLNTQMSNCTLQVVVMHMQLKIVIFVNVLLSLLFVVSNCSIWVEVKQWSLWNIASVWSPIYITPYRIPNTPQVQMPILPLWNIPFALFWVAMAVNLYFVVRLLRTKKTP